MTQLVEATIERETYEATCISISPISKTEMLFAVLPVNQNRNWTSEETSVALVFE